MKEETLNQRHATRAPLGNMQQQRNIEEAKKEGKQGLMIQTFTLS